MICIIYKAYKGLQRIVGKVLKTLKLDNEQFEDDETEFLEIKNDLKVAKEYQYK